MSDMHDDDSPLRELWARFRRGAKAPSGICPDPNVLAAYLDGTLPAAEAETVEAHLASCAGCLDTVTAFRSVEREAAQTPEAVVRRAKALVAPRLRVVWKAVRWTAAAASLLLACASGYVLGARSAVTRMEIDREIAKTTSVGIAPEAAAPGAGR